MYYYSRMQRSVSEHGITMVFHWAAVVVVFLSLTMFATPQKAGATDTADVIGAAPASSVAIVYSESQYRVEQPGRLYGSTIHNVLSMSTGTGFLVQHNGGMYFLTAAHVIHDPSPTRLPLGGRTEDIGSETRSKLLSANCRVRIGGLSISPHRLFMAYTPDIAVIRLTERDLKLLTRREGGIEVYTLVPARPRRGDKVTMYGFPGTTSPKHAESSVVDVPAGQRHFVLNDPLVPGFSGGPVLTSEGAVTGLLVRSTEKQARCMGPEAIRAAIEASEKQSKPYRDRMVYPR